jgi:hypothetical protein
MARDFSRRGLGQVTDLSQRIKKGKKQIVEKLDARASWGAAVLRPYMRLQV